MMRGSKSISAHVRVGLAVLVVLVSGACGTSPQGTEAARQAPLDVADILGSGSTEGFARALEPREFRFPADHGSHPDFRNEWWYFTGNLSGPDGERYGYQLTIFRTALTPDSGARASAWATRQVYMGHLAVGDARAGTFRAFDRFSRGALQLAGAESGPLRVWIEDWEVRERQASGERPTAGRLPGDPLWLPSLNLRAREAGVGIDLQLEPERPLVLNGEAGLSRKGPTAGNASYYYSAPRLRTRGTLWNDGREVEVEGTSWLDREWSTSALEGDQVGWDWFALHLSDGRDLMVYVLRRADGTVSVQSAGTLIDPLGNPRHLRAGELSVEVLETWTSPRGATYPARWRIVVAGGEIDLEVTPMLADQELDVAVRYWEGAVSAEAPDGAGNLRAEGFVELTGY